MKLKHGQHILFWNLGWCLGSTVSPHGSMFLATLLYWYTCSGSLHHVASGVQSLGAPRHGTNKCTTIGGSLRAYCSIPYTGLGSHSSHSRLSPVWFQGWISLNLKGSRIVIVNPKTPKPLGNDLTKLIKNITFYLIDFLSLSFGYLTTFCNSHPIFTFSYICLIFLAL